MFAEIIFKHLIFRQTLNYPINKTITSTQSQIFIPLRLENKMKTWN